jgi:peptidoglycan glycosyltransferase
VSRLRRILAPLFIALGVLVGLLLFVTSVPLRRARDAWREGRNAEAIATANRWSRMRLWETQYAQITAASYLTVGNVEAAKPSLALLAQKQVWLPAIGKDELARRLFARGRYAEFLAYDAASRELRERPVVLLDRAAALAGSGRLAEAGELLRRVNRKAVDAQRVRALEEALVQRSSGSYPLLLDREGHALAVYQSGNRDLVAVDANVAPLVEREAGSLTFESQLRSAGVNDTIETTLDPAVQRAAVAALGGFRGSLVAIDPRTNEILAIASSRGSGPMANLALEHQYEPGSVVKVLTALNALSSGSPVQTMFPYHCSGDLLIDGRHFGDWLPQGHGELASLDDALAESCNIAFADIGLRLGTERLRQFMTRAGFDGQTNLGLFEAPLGKTIPPIFNRYETAFYAIGLAHESITTLHVAMLASMMANRGALTQPRLLRARRSILGDVVTEAPAQGSVQLAPKAAAEQVVHAMTAVVTSPRGTGRRAALDGVSLAMKTGTAGERQSGLEALILGFAPVAQPKIAFGIIAEDAGPAEFAGAKITRDFLEALKDRL